MRQFIAIAATAIISAVVASWGTTVIMATHDQDIVNTFKKRVVELRDGRVIRDQARGVYGDGS